MNDLVDSCPDCGHQETWHSWGGCQVEGCKCDNDDEEAQGRERKAPSRD